MNDNHILQLSIFTKSHSQVFQYLFFSIPLNSSVQYAMFTQAISNDRFFHFFSDHRFSFSLWFI